MLIRSIDAYGLQKFYLLRCDNAFVGVSLKKISEPTDKGKAVPVTGLEWPRGFQEVKVPRLHDNGTRWW
jgi:hypothetical protein